MPSKQSRAIEALFLAAETVTVTEIYEALYGPKGDRTNRELSQAVGPALSRYYKRTGNNVRTVKPYTYTLEYA